MARRKSDRRKRAWLTVSIDPAVSAAAFRDPGTNKSRVVQVALSLHQREALCRQIEEFCAEPGASDIRDAERALPAQRDVLDRD